MCTIYLLRHGRTPLDNLKRSDGWLDLPLSDKGRIGLIPAQQYLKLEPIKHIHTSPLRRTTETAHIIQSGIISAPNVTTAPEAMTWDLGILAGTPKRYSHPKVQRLMDSPGTKPKGGESYNAFEKRFMPWFMKQVAEAKTHGKPVLVVGSGSNLRAVGKALFGDPEAFNLDEGGLVELTEKDGKWTKKIIFGDEDKAEHVS